MHILLWILQFIIAVFCIMGSVWRFLNYEQAAQDIASMAALSKGMWDAIGAFEVICAIGLVLPGILRTKANLTPVAAACLTVEMLFVTALHVNYFGFQIAPTNPAMWTIMLGALAAFVAFGRLKLRPL